MIRVRLLGHIRSSVGSEEVVLPEREMETGALVDRLRSMCKGSDPGFNRFNTLVVVEEGEAFVPAAASRVVREGDKVVLVPFSHGG